MMGARGVENEGMFVGNLLLLAGLGLIISAQWEMVRGSTFSYTALSAFGKIMQCSPWVSFSLRAADKESGFYYAGYGIMLLPSLGIIESYGGRTSEYYNAFGLYLAGISLPSFCRIMLKMAHLR